MGVKLVKVIVDLNHDYVYYQKSKYKNKRYIYIYTINGVLIARIIIFYNHNKGDKCVNQTN